MQVALGCDESALGLKNHIKVFLEQSAKALWGIYDYGIHTPEPVAYPDIALKVALSIRNGKHERGLLFCGTGIGMCIAANKVPGIRAAQCHDVYSAERAQLSNNAQIITIGARVIGTELAQKIVETFLRAEFIPGPSTPKIDKIMAIEARYLLKKDDAENLNV